MCPNYTPQYQPHQQQSNIPYISPASGPYPIKAAHRVTARSQKIPGEENLDTTSNCQAGITVVKQYMPQNDTQPQYLSHESQGYNNPFLYEMKHLTQNQPRMAYFNQLQQQPVPAR